MIWFTSDTHFGHENVLKFTDRPWETIQQMNSSIVANINARVGMNDELYILGDFSFKMTAQDAYGLRVWFSGVGEPCGRVKWPWWVNQTGDRQVERELAAYKRERAN